MSLQLIHHGFFEHILEHLYFLLELGQLSQLGLLLLVFLIQFFEFVLEVILVLHALLELFGELLVFLFDFVDEFLGGLQEVGAFLFAFVQLRLNGLCVQFELLFQLEDFTYRKP